jgi:hypothetical protein
VFDRANLASTGGDCVEASAMNVLKCGLKTLGKNVSVLHTGLNRKLVNIVSQPIHL